VGGAILDSMSAGEILKEVKALPRRERERILKAILDIEADEATQVRMKTKRVRWPDVEARAKRIFGNRVLPNLVLLEREEEAF
jgi:hypothetical protein